MTVRAVLILLTVATVVLTPTTARAWGFGPHRFIMDRAIALLPAELRPFFERNRATVVERAIDPDTWRTAGFEDENKNHFLDIDWQGYGPYPFRALPRDYDAAVAKFGLSRIEANGTVPWRAAEFFDRLRRAFEAYPGRGPTGGLDVLFFSAALGHYVADAHVPFHAVVDYDGQRTGQRGIHARFESVLFERYEARLSITARAVLPIDEPRDFVFDRIVEGTTLVPAILQSDRAALGASGTYDEAYYDAFFRANRRVLERRVTESIQAVAAMIAGAWHAAGRPAVELIGRR